MRHGMVHQKLRRCVRCRASIRAAAAAAVAHASVPDSFAECFLGPAGLGCRVHPTKAFVILPGTTMLFVCLMRWELVDELALPIG
jgi:hypothetical protein